MAECIRGSRCDSYDYQRHYLPAGAVMVFDVRRDGMGSKYIAICLIACAATAQEPEQSENKEKASQDSSKQIEELKVKQSEQEKKIKELEEKIQLLSTEKPDEEKRQEELKRLTVELEYLKKLHDDLGKKVKEIDNRQQDFIASENAFNPAIAAFFNFAVRNDSQRVRNRAGTTISNSAFLRTAEVDFRQQVVPAATAVMILSVETDGDKYSVDPDETYATMKSLPFLESIWPAGMKLVGGRFRLPFGHTNQLHLHDLMWITRPLPVVEYLGSNSGTSFFDAGVSVDGGYVDLNLPQTLSFSREVPPELLFGVVGSNRLAITSNTGGPGYAPFSRLQFRDTFDKSGEFLIGLSGYYEGTDRLFGLDIMYKWVSQSADEKRSILIGAELFQGNRNVGGIERPFGATAYFQDQIWRPLYVGIRLETAESVTDSKLSTQVFSLHATYYVSDYIRIRMSFERTISDIDDVDGDNAIMFDLNAAFGAKPVEPFWVNK